MTNTEQRALELLIEDYQARIQTIREEIAKDKSEVKDVDFINSLHQRLRVRLDCHRTTLAELRSLLFTSNT